MRTVGHFTNCTAPRPGRPARFNASIGAGPATRPCVLSTPPLSALPGTGPWRPASGSSPARSPHARSRSGAAATSRKRTTAERRTPCRGRRPGRRRRERSCGRNPRAAPSRSRSLRASRSSGSPRPGRSGCTQVDPPVAVQVGRREARPTRQEASRSPDASGTSANFISPGFESLRKRNCRCAWLFSPIAKLRAFGLIQEPITAQNRGRILPARHRQVVAPVVVVVDRRRSHFDRGRVGSRSPPNAARSASSKSWPSTLR